MVVEQISREDLLKVSRESLGLPKPSDMVIDDILLAALLRRAAGILCPCSPVTIVSSVLDSLQYLVEKNDQIPDRLTRTIEQLIVIGDLLELNQVTTDDPAVKSTWVFAAPPSFVERPDGSVFLLGIVPDDTTPLPAGFKSRIIYDRATRVVIPETSENLRSTLLDLGWLELSKSAWLKAPKPSSDVELRQAIQSRLETQPESGAILDLSILDPSRDVRYYANRWVTPTNQSGHYVARRPQAYGAPIWGYASLVSGSVTKFLDLPLKGTRWRGCDIAWHLQMAIDRHRGTPQLYRRREGTGGAFLDLFSPLPMWAERRLAVLGRPAAAEKCLFSYWIPEPERASEEGFLRERLWLASRED